MSRFLTHNDITIDASSTSLKGYIDISYDELVDKFGLPLEGDGYKVDAEWQIDFGNGIPATIYNYKNGKNYLGANGIKTEDIRDWYIGGNKIEIIKLIHKIFPDAPIIIDIDHTKLLRKNKIWCAMSKEDKIKNCSFKKISNAAMLSMILIILTMISIPIIKNYTSTQEVKYGEYTK